ncbi:YheV family putative zinc ribbon protein [Thaumasiovibrio sp. DFM-14]|uniref:YheV family putative zinc ribbon protein n=1 Tax=Thaumasiovibrio sp. DFM-14 TaxID=3384792 RepID=UPI0039A1B753
MKKRFIAGAHCPKCHSVDSIRWWKEAQIETIECVQCGHQAQQLPEALTSQRPNGETVIGLFNPKS